MTRDPVVVRQEVAAPPAEVLRQFTNSTCLREWFCDVATVRAENGGRLYLGWNHGYGVVGNYTSIVPGRAVTFTWVGSMDPGPSQVAIDLAPSAAGTTVTVTHDGPVDGDAERFERGMRRMWESGLQNLASVVATGHDLRFTLRPMLGVMVEAEVDAARAADLGLPVDHGVVLSGTAEGLGARAAGLRGGDVVVAIGDTPITGFPAFAVALEGRHAGETVDVVFYRDGTEHRSAMTLSGRPIPEVPATAAALAAHVADLYAWVDAEVTAALAGATEEAAATRPGPDEWSAREVLAHLMDGEGDYHSYITELVLGAERSSDGPYENSDLRVRVTAASYPTVAEMLAAYRHLEQQTVALLAGLPDEFVARKGSFWRLAYGYTQARPHYEEHVAQIRAAVAASG